jgi:carboxyl-terminal processing protease
MSFDGLRDWPVMHLVFPSSIPGIEASLPLLRAERAELEAMFGIPVVFVDEDPGIGPRWLVRFEPDRADNRLAWDRDRLVLTSNAKDADGWMMTINQLHSLIGLGIDAVSDRAHGTMAEAVARLRREIAGTFPGFGIRGLDWNEITARHLRGDGSTMTFEDVQRWVAELGDAHTAVRRPGSVYHPPYAVEMRPDGATIRRVREGSEAWHTGVRAGWSLQIDDPDGWMARNGAPPHAHALTAGRRAIALEGVEERAFTATGPEGKMVTWTEHAAPPALDRVFGWRWHDARTGVMWLGNWYTGLGLEDALDEALLDLRDAERLVLDLRGNTGGNLMLAIGTRRRFLRERTLLGTIRFTRGDGTLAEPVELWDEPPDDRVRWEGELIVLTDPLTYSASEDFLLGLQGLSHVTVIGQRSGGGSGRPRTIPVLDDMLVTISTALTFDRNGVCVEGHGIPVDLEMPVFEMAGQDLAMKTALGLPA